MPDWLRLHHRVLAAGYLATAVLLAAMPFDDESSARYWVLFAITMPTSILVMTPFVLYPLLALGMVLHLPESVALVAFWLVPATANVALAMLWVRSNARGRASTPTRRRPPRRSFVRRLDSARRPTRAKLVTIVYIALIAALGAVAGADNGATGMAVWMLTWPASLFISNPAALPLLSVAPWTVVWTVPAVLNAVLVHLVIRGHRSGRPVEMRLNRSGFGSGHGCALRSPSIS